MNLPLAFLIPSTSGHATLAMPILAPLADFAGVSRAVVVTAWQAASGWMNLWVPTTAVTIGGVALAKVGYDKYLRFIWPLLGHPVRADLRVRGGRGGVDVTGARRADSGQP